MKFGVTESCPGYRLRSEVRGLRSDPGAPFLAVSSREVGGLLLWGGVAPLARGFWTFPRSEVRGPASDADAGCPTSRGVPHVSPFLRDVGIRIQLDHPFPPSTSPISLLNSSSGV
jgi:hypothetical protein